MLPLALVVATTVAFHPFSVSRSALLDGAAHQPGDPEPDPSWNEDTPEETVPEPDADAPAPEQVGEEGLDGEEAGEDELGQPEPGEDQSLSEVAEAPPPPSGTPELRPQTVDDLVIPQKKGTGLLIAAGALGATAWGIMGWRMTMLDECSQGYDTTGAVDEDFRNSVDQAFGCAGARVKTMVTWVLQGSLNAVSWGLAAGGADVRANHDAAKSVKTGKPQRKDVVFIATGAAVLAVGVGGRIAVAVLRPRIRTECLNGAMTTGDYFDCYGERFKMHFFGQQITASAIGAGIGLLTYGASYRVRRARYQKGYGGAEQQAYVRVVPQLGGVYNGLSLEGRF